MNIELPQKSPINNPILFQNVLELSHSVSECNLNHVNYNSEAEIDDAFGYWQQKMKEAIYKRQQNA